MSLYSKTKNSSKCLYKGGWTDLHFSHKKNNQVSCYAINKKMGAYNNDWFIIDDHKEVGHNKKINKIDNELNNNRWRYLI